MSSDPFKLPGNDHQKNFDEMFAKPKSGGGGGGGNTARRHAEEKAQKELDQEFEEAHKQEAKKEPAEENPKQKPVVKISNGKWHHEKGQFNKKATAKVDVQLPDSHKDLTRIVFTLHSIDKYGKKLRVDSKEAHVKHGIAEIEFTLYRASQRDATDVRIETPYIITAKHTNSEEHDTGRLPVSEELESVTLEEAQNIAFEITKQYETGGSYSILAGDFDGAGMSFGSMQWNAKWGTLQKILAKFRAANKATFNKCFENNESALKAIAIFIEEEQ